MTLSTLRPAEFAAATLAAAAVLLLAVAPALLVAPPAVSPGAGARAASSAGIEFRLPREARGA